MVGKLFAPNGLPFGRLNCISSEWSRIGLFLREARFKFLEAKHHLLDDLELLGRLTESESPKLGELEFQMLDLPVLFDHQASEGFGSVR